MIANSGHDENGKYHGGKAGDQTGTEWQIIAWYNRPWSVVLRFEDSKIASTIAELAEEAAKNNNIGYDQYERTTFWKALKNAGYHPKNITVKCEADCSAGVLAICKATGYLLGNAKLKDIDETGYTGNERKILVAAGAKALTDKKYLTSDKYLKRGDILLYEGHHTAINLTNGSGTSTSTATDPLSKYTDAQLADKVINGDFGTGDARKKALGSRYDAVQKIVNQKLSASKAVYYYVRRSDTLSSIAKRYGTTVNALVKLNGIKNPNLIKIGQRIRIK